MLGSDASAVFEAKRCAMKRAKNSPAPHSTATQVRARMWANVPKCRQLAVARGNGERLPVDHLANCAVV